MKAGPDARAVRRDPLRPRLGGRGRGRSRRDRTIGIGLAALVAVYASMALASPMGTMIHGDGYYTYLWARTIVFDGDLDFHDDYRLCGDPWGLARNPVGDDVNYWNLGPSLFWIPVLAFDKLTGHPALDSSDPVIANGCRGPLAERAVRGSFVAGLLTLLMGFVFARRYVGDRPALFGTAGIGLAGSLLFYSTSMMSYGHAASAFGAGLAVLAWERYRDAPTEDRRAWRGWALMGAALGVAMLMRAQNAVIVILPLGTWVAIAARHVRARDARVIGRHVAQGVLFTLALFLVFSPQLSFWHAATGSWVTVPQGSGYMRWDGSMPHKALFSAQGLFAWTPIHYLATAGFVALAWRRSTRGLGVALLALFAVESFVVGAAYDWNGSVGFPGRRFDALAVPFIVGLAACGRALWRWASRRPSRGVALLAGITLVAVFAWNASVTVGVARGMRTDTARPSPSQWGDTFGPLSRGVWQAVGNPLTWPASIPFALYYDAHPRRFDVIGGPELFHHDERTLRWREPESTIDFRASDASLYLDGRVDDHTSTVRGRNGVIVFPGTSRLLLPIHWPDVGAFAFTVTPLAEGVPVRLGATWNGVRLGTRRVTSDAAVVRIPVLPGSSEQGINELYLWVEGGSLLLERLQILDPDPPPSAWAAEDNRRLLEERRRLTGRAPSR